MISPQLHSAYRREEVDEGMTICPVGPGPRVALVPCLHDWWGDIEELLGMFVGFWWIAERAGKAHGRAAGNEREASC